ncbi:hypothetical protein [Hyphomicrobium sp. MC1]|uniref:hypothetical protein n=1 Tax=Hyphomicrobium sp. (strain MC1) TaxID=717785 RepID=UPI000213E1B5|nr:hypothetical protein [Hyphomicrobium sp. MC1]CCB65237.1 protein of unknown function [Hyphomicrobium sp. MC1]
MTLNEISNLMRDIAPVIREFVAAELKPFTEKIETLTKRVNASTFDGKKFGEDIVAAVDTYIEREIAPVLERQERVERVFDRLDGRIDAIALRGVAAHVDENAIIARTVDAVTPFIDERVQEAVASIPALTADDVRPLIETEVAAAVERLKKEKTASQRVAAMTINRSGILIAQTDDGEYRSLGAVVEHQAEEFSYDEAITLGVRALTAPSIRREM